MNMHNPCTIAVAHYQDFMDGEVFPFVENDIHQQRNRAVRCHRTAEGLATLLLFVRTGTGRILTKGDFMDIITFLIIGLIAGWAASLLVKGHGFGVIGDIIVGVIGAFVGGFIFNFFGTTTYGFWGSVGTAIVGAVVLLLIAGWISHRGSMSNHRVT
jgi:uncharacterized membrane protein YeaQ/YmgE (transglycosylase-associated protein family)